LSRDSHVLAGPHGPIRVEGDALAGLVIAAAEGVEGARVRRPRRGLDVEVEGERVRVDVELAARHGAVLPELARTVQERVADALRAATALRVERVDVAVEELDG
jgi:uncharacterized alkaline shock family protein YloU